MRDDKLLNEIGFVVFNFGLWYFFYNFKNNWTKV